MWKGVIIEESLGERSVLDLVKIKSSRKATLEGENGKGNFTFHCIELDDGKKDEFVRKSSTTIKDGFYIHICRGDSMTVIYRNRVFEFSRNEKEKLDKARGYGLSIGIKREQMPFEGLINNPHA